MYFVIYSSEGDPSVRTFETAEKVMKYLSVDEEDEFTPNTLTLDALKYEGDINYWGKNILIIKGDVVNLIPKEVVTQYELE